MEINNQRIDGIQNKVAGGNITEYHVYGAELERFFKPDEPIIFFEDDLKLILTNISLDLTNKASLPEDLTRVKIERKNEINKLSDSYFKLILDSSFPYFQQIDDFLKDPMNGEYLALYEQIVIELRQHIIIHREEKENFECFIVDMFNYIISKHQDFSFLRRRLLLVLLHFMYWKCDIGEKE